MTSTGTSYDPVVLALAPYDVQRGVSATSYAPAVLALAPHDVPREPQGLGPSGQAEASRVAQPAAISADSI